MNKEQTEYNFLKHLNSFLDERLVGYKDKVKTLQNITEVKQDILNVIDRVLPEDADKIITKSKRRDYVGKQMKLLEHQQSLLREKVNGILNQKTLKAENTTKRLVVDRKQGKVSGE